MTATPSPDKLRANLAAQSAAAAELERLLESEHAALAIRDWPAVLALAGTKGAAVARMQALMRDLSQLATGRPLSQVIEGAGLDATWNELMERAARLQRANRESRARMDAHADKAATALRVLQRGGAAGVYGRDGRSGFAPASQALARA